MNESLDVVFKAGLIASSISKEMRDKMARIGNLGDVYHGNGRSR